jgi:hypothetical protein
MTGPRQFHLRGSKSHHPTINLAGETETKAGAKIPFGDERKKKLAWMSSYCGASEKLAADPTGAENDYWLMQARDEEAKEAARQHLAGTLGRAPTEQEVAAEFEAHKFGYRNLSTDKSSFRRSAATNSQLVDPTKIQDAQAADYDRKAQAFAQLPDDQKAQLAAQGIEAPRLRQSGLQTVTDDQGVPQDVTNPDLVNAGTYAADAAQRRFLANKGENERNSIQGATGMLEPVAQVHSGGLADVLSPVGQLVQAAMRRQPVDKNGRLVRLPSAASSPGLESMATGLDERGRLQAQYNQAVAENRPADAEAIKGQLAGMTGKWQDQNQLARENVGGTSRTNTLGGAGNTWSQLAGSRLWDQMSQLGKSGVKLPLPIKYAPVAPLMGPALAAAIAPRGQSLEAAKEAVVPALSATAQGLGGTGAVRLAVPSLTGQAVGASRPAAALWDATRRGLTPGVTGATSALSKARNFGGNAAMGATLISGAKGMADLGRQAYNWGDSEDPNAVANEQEVGNQSLANETSGAGGKLWDATKAGTGALLNGNIDDARRQFGASYGRVLPNTPAGRAVQSAKREMYATNQGQQGYDQTLNTIGADPRLDHLDPSTAGTLARLGAEHAESAGKLDFNRGTNEQVGTDWLGRYSQARQALMERRALSPPQVALMEEVSGAKRNPESGQLSLTPEQYQLAARNAALYHRVGRNNAQQILRGNQPGEMTGSGGTAQRNAPAVNTIQYAQGVIPPGPGATATPPAQQAVKPTPPSSQPIAQVPKPIVPHP